MIDLSDHLMLATIIGSVVIGVGCGMVVRNKATTGGSDIVAMIFQKYAHVKFSSAIFFVDSCVIMFGVIVICFGFGTEEATTPSLHLMFYSIIAIYVASRVLAFTITGAKNDKLLFIISEDKLPTLHHYILNDLDRTATCVKASGLYTKQEKEMFFLVVREKEANMVKHRIRDYDPRAFVIIMSAQATYGEGWRALPVKGEVEPE